MERDDVSNWFIFCWLSINEFSTVSLQNITTVKKLIIDELIGSRHWKWWTRRNFVISVYVYG